MTHKITRRPAHSSQSARRVRDAGEIYTFGCNDALLGKRAYGKNFAGTVRACVARGGKRGHGLMIGGELVSPTRVRTAMKKSAMVAAQLRKRWGAPDFEPVARRPRLARSLGAIQRAPQPSFARAPMQLPSRAFWRREEIAGPAYPLIQQSARRGGDASSHALDAKFHAYHKAHPAVLRELIKLARQHPRTSINGLWEQMRSATGTSPNNSYKSRYARAVMASSQDLAGRFATRSNPRRHRRAW